jgi:hypothetical protein
MFFRMEESFKVICKKINSDRKVKKRNVCRIIPTNIFWFAI